MQVDLSLGNLVNATGALLFVAAGIVILGVGRRTRSGILVGGTAATYGLTYVANNILVPDADGAAIVLACALPSLLLVVALALDLVRPLRRRSRRVVLLAVGPLALLVSVFAASASAPEISPTLIASYLPAEGRVGVAAAAALIAQQAGFILLVLALGARALESNDASDLRRIACLGIAYGPWTLLVNMDWAGAAAIVPIDTLAGIAFLASFLGLAVAAPLAALPFAAVRGRTPDRLVRAAFPAMLLGGAAALVAGLANTELGLYGVARTSGFPFLALAVLKHDLLGVPLPRVAVNRGAVAATALASLFIVAEVAQNFLSAEYGLLMGGVVAGAFLFAAHPIQRAIEGRTRTSARAALSRDSAARREEASYLHALRLALRDRTLTREEERGLVVLAHDLGIDPRRAHELQDQVEAELRVGREA